MTLDEENHLNLDQLMLIAMALEATKNVAEENNAPEAVINRLNETFETVKSLAQIEYEMNEQFADIINTSLPDLEESSEKIIENPDIEIELS